MTLTTLPLTAAPAAPATDTPPAVPDAPDTTTSTPSAASSPHTRTSEPRPAASSAPARRSERTARAVAILAVFGGAILAGIGFAGSYSALRQLGFEHGLGDFAAVFPIGLDAGIVVLLALDLLLIRYGIRLPILRLIAHGFTAATIVFNANAGDKTPLQDPIGAAMHGVIPVMFIAAVEAARKLVIRAIDLDTGRKSNVGIPLFRWVLSPSRTWSMWRSLKLWGLSSYDEVVAREQELSGYRVLLERKYGKVRKAPSDERLPLTMARYGLTVREALELPEKQARLDRERREAEAERLLEEERAEQERSAERKKMRLRAAGSVQTTEAKVNAQTAAAERLAALEAEALDSAVLAEARARQTAAEAREAEERARRKAAERQAAEEELRAAKLRSEAAEKDRAAELEARAVETQRAAEARRAAAEADRRAREDERRAAEERARVARAEAHKEADRRAAAEAKAAAAKAEQAAVEARARALKAERAVVEAEDTLRLSPRERAVRKVARLVLTEAAGQVERLPLDRVAEATGVSTGTASQYRTEAAELIAGGYRL